jgi:glutamine amidotransferase-like uncharacterized protein
MYRSTFRFIFIFLISALYLSSPCFAKQETKKLLGKGKVWETPYYIIDSEVDGPTVFITGGVHGNEPSGSFAADQIRHWPIIRGRLIVIPRVNTMGLANNTRFIPDSAEHEKDLNRNFPLNNLKEGAKGEIAQAVWDLVIQYDPDWLFDLHEGYEFNISHQPPSGKSKSVGSSIIYKSSKSLDPLVLQMQATVNDSITDPERKFTRLTRGPKRTTLADAANRFLNIRSMILETTFNFQRLHVRTRQHRMMMNVVLNHLKVVDQDCQNIVTPPESERDNHIYVGLYDDEGGSEKGVHYLTKVMVNSPNLSVAHLGADDIHSEMISQFDVMVFGGGRGSKQAASIKQNGSEAVRAYVLDGGGYVGICGGAFLCSAHYKWSLNLIDTHVFTGAKEVEGKGKKQMWYRGNSSNVKMQLTQEGKKVFGDIPENTLVRYQNGPIVSPKNFKGLKPYVPLAYFRTEKVLYPPQKGTMVNTPAIVKGEYGEGNVISISPHPESTDGLESMIISAINAIVSSKAALSAQ